MIVKPIEEISNIDELSSICDQIVEKTPVDMAYSSSVKRMLRAV